MLGRKVIYVRCINCSYNNVAKGIRLFEKRHSIGVQSVVLPFSVYRNRFIMFWSYFFVLKLGVYVRLVKSLLILSFSFINTVKEELKNSKFGGKTSVTL